MSNASSRISLIERLINRTGVHRSEATIQSDVRMLLLDPELGLAEDQLDVELETQAGHGRRIDVEVGCTVIEVKRTLASPSAVEAATAQLTGYVTSRSQEMGQRYVGILTDGALWIAFHEVDGALEEATRHTAGLGSGGAESLLRWLEGVLATKKAIRPTPTEIADRLGAQSSSHALDFSTLEALYQDSKDMPTVMLKRDLWANLLRSALGTQFTNSDELFLEHTLLVNSAEIIAHLVLGLNAEELSPSTLLAGDQFTIAGLHGVVDRDFFDWVLEVPGGDGFIKAMARRLSRFDWSAVEHDVLKVLYESVISAETRKALGEYYTPDWLAHEVVSEVVTDPLHQRVLDPSCGSGTFLFYAVRRYLAAAHNDGVPLKAATSLVSSRVMGIDLHPVAVALARVTYLLAIGRDRLTDPDRGTISVPVYLGDSLGWDQRDDLISVDHLVIPTEVGDQLVSGDLRFPDHLLTDASHFDNLVQTLVDESGRAAGKPKVTRLSEGAVRRLALTNTEDLHTLNTNFLRLKELHEADRDHIWSYYVRNVSRPAWLSREENRVDVLVGNPPWLSYRHMTESMQRRFKSMASSRGFWHNETTATHQDLAGLFVARAVERYLKSGGTFGFVVPNSVIDRPYWGGFRDGRFEGANIDYAMPWDLRRIRPHLFPRGSAVIFGTRGSAATVMPTQAVVWSGRAPHRHSSIKDAVGLRHTVAELSITAEDSPRSTYASRFSNGASLVPRVFFRVTDIGAGSLGVPSGRVRIRSDRSVTEKKPWKELPDLEGTVESEFVFPTVLGEHIIPFRLQPLDQFVVPVTQTGNVLNADGDRITAYPGLTEWMREADARWLEHRSSLKMTLVDQINHMQKLTQQMPPAPLRVVYGKSGMHLTAALLDDPRALVENTAYWCAVNSPAEGRFLVGILNAPITTELVRPLMSYGKDERDIHMHVWRLPIPLYDASNDLHLEIARLSGELADEISELEFSSDYFVTIRKQVRAHITNSPTGRELNQLVGQLLDVDVDLADDPTPDGPSAPLLRVTSGDLPLPGADVEIDIDCEFDITRTVYLWGATINDGTSQSYHHVGSPDPDVDETALTEEFAAWLLDQITDHQAAGRTVAIYHYNSTEATQLRRLVPEFADQILVHAVDLLSVIRANFYGPYGYGLKTLSSAIAAHQWHTQGATGELTLQWIEQARAGDASMWNQIVEYNRDDTEATAALRRQLRDQ